MLACSFRVGVLRLVLSGQLLGGARSLLEYLLFKLLAQAILADVALLGVEARGQDERVLVRPLRLVLFVLRLLLGIIVLHDFTPLRRLLPLGFQAELDLAC